MTHPTASLGQAVTDAATGEIAEKPFSGGTESKVEAATSLTASDACLTPEEPATTGPIIRVAILGDRHPSPAEKARELFTASGWCRPAFVPDASKRALAGFDVTVLLDPTGGHPTDAHSRDPDLDALLDRMHRLGIGVLILTHRPWVFAGCNAGVVCLSHEASMDTVQGVLLALARLRPILRQINKEVASMQRLGENLHRQFEEVDRELQLASRMQRDFLPRQLPEVGPIRFSTLYRPCSWVSGDIFDVFRLDETHLGFYLADAVGHGVAAGLLTMYIKNAIQPKRIRASGYELVRPSDILATLNDQFVAQDLPDSQFITAWYGMINTRTLQINYAVAGHPPPLLIDPDGTISELHGKGCILGVFEGQAFEDRAVTLRPGRRVLLYSDGLESVLIAHRPPIPQNPTLQDGIVDLLRLGTEEMKARLIARLDASPHSLKRADDVSLVVLDVLDEGRPGP